MNFELDYLDNARDILDNGNPKPDRTQTGTFSRFGMTLQADLRDGFPLITTKLVRLSVVAEELRWMLSGSTNVNSLDASIWDDWADEHGDLGPVYGKQFRSWPNPHGKNIDQIAETLDSLKNNPHSRRHVVSAWEVADLAYMTLPPCHVLFQFYVADGQLDCQLYQRSADWFIGVPFNIASYALLTRLFAEECGYEAGRLFISYGDAHIYQNHEDVVREQLTRDPKPKPTLDIDVPDGANAVLDFDPEWLNLIDYEHDPELTAEVAV